MAKFDFDIGILGGGSGGLTVAAGAAQLGAKTLLVDKEGRLGGDCLHYGCVPSKTLIMTARVRHLMQRAGRYGLPGLDLPPVNFGEVAKRIQHVIGIIQKHDSEERFCRLGAKVEFGESTFIDEHSIRLNGTTYSAKNWVIATGSSPSTPAIQGLDKTPFITNRHIFSLERLPKSMIIFGGGPVGTEMAQAFVRLGSKVTLIQRADQILPKEDKDMADLVMNVLRNEGVTFYLKTSVESVRDLGSEREVLIKTSEGSTVTLRSERILLATGRDPNVEGLGLKEIGVYFDMKGIEVDDRMRTTHKHIYAIGDVNGRYLFTHAAGYEGGIVVGNAVFHLPRKADFTYLPWCTYTDPELANIGMNETIAKVAGIEYSVWTEEFRSNDRSLAEGEEAGKIKMLLNAKEEPIGVQIFGPHAGELVNEWVAVMNGKVRFSSLVSAIHPYPTLGEINKKVAANFLSTKIFSDKVKKGLRFFFNLKGRACGP
ncbi:MAG TPA: FAD-dependent oxidoreductase [Thermodesulfovibrionales bacterium]|jgi:pyruvate/2-oxoglutarate dehydrogenase complex dihydrolipoamide dehydrogenase (E3) component|nr:FAD-dependent oxidoreductase [Thermodesulfovibrionales bacterium]